MRTRTFSALALAAVGAPGPAHVHVHLYSQFQLRLQLQANKIVVGLDGYQKLAPAELEAWRAPVFSLPRVGGLPITESQNPVAYACSTFGSAQSQIPNAHVHTRTRPAAGSRCGRPNRSRPGTCIWGAAHGQSRWSWTRIGQHNFDICQAIANLASAIA